MVMTSMLTSDCWDDAMDGDQTLFARQDGVEAAWAVVDNVLGNVTPVYEYAPGSWGPSQESQLTNGSRKLAQSGACLARSGGTRGSGFGARRSETNAEPSTPIRNPEPFIRSPHPSPSSPHSRPQHPPSAAQSRESSNCRTPSC